jgi:arginyl-tRNA synthetase
LLTTILTDLLEKAFGAAGFDEEYGVVVSSNRPDLCQFQCNGAMSAAKKYKKAPFIISDAVIEQLNSFEEAKDIFELVETVKPGFINITCKDTFITQYINTIINDEKCGYQPVESPQTIVIDYGGPNIAKPLHVGHLRTAIIGQSLKNLYRFIGHNVIGDIHLGDWGLQMGMVITGIYQKDPSLPYFDETFTGEYPKEPPFTLNDLEEIYPRISKLAKADEDIMQLSKEFTNKLQNKEPGPYTLWRHIVNVSIEDIKKNYERLNVDFDLWYGESDSSDYVDEVVDLLREKNVVFESDGATVVDVSTKEEELPPLILYKTDGSILYGTTDLATIYQRIQDFNPDTILYVVDSRQGTHFKQVFNCVYQNNLVRENVSLEHIGFGTMNGKDGKPFKTRDGGIIKLSELINMVETDARNRIKENEEIDINEISKLVGLATLKFADLSNYRTKDYVFDLDKFSSFEGKTGPYILYSYVRINNILNKFDQDLLTLPSLLSPASDVERNMLLKLAEFPFAINLAAKDRAPNNICEYVYDLSTLFNTFYHKHHIINEENLAQQKSWLSLLTLTRRLIKICLDILGMKAPEKM